MKSSLRRYCLILALLVTATINSYSQKDLLLGVKAGIDIPNLTAGNGSGSNPVSKGWSSRLGPYFGAVCIYKLTGKFALQAELNYSSQGGKKNGKQAIPTSDFTPNPPTGTPEYLYANLNSVSRLNYLELPVMARLSFPLGKGWHFFVTGGPYFGYLVAAKDIVKGTSNVYADENEQMPLTPQAITFDNSQDVKSDIKKFNVGIQGGIGISTRAPAGSIMLNIGGNYGFIPIQKDKANGQNNTGAANITVGYLFKL
ncbi:MAG TPA: porin family protein [Chitinophagaceae bacterium]|nr:porin family protein [Chitinophagaceae bacterium]